jgi:HTH-type transcriptional regulator/antitoxin HigA
MVRRGWIGSSADLDVLERNVCAFLGIDTIDDDPPIVPHAARKSTSYSEVTAAQRAWLIRAVALASMVEAEPFTERRLGRAYERLRGLLRSPEHVARVPGVLADGGVRLVVVEHLPQTRIDGAAFWIGAKSPVVALSLRYDRIDCFWHTLMHDLAHIKNGDVLWTDSSDSLLLDSDLVGSHRESGNDRPKCEERADREAAGFLVSQPSLDAFICEVRPRYSKARIASFAKAEGVHPGLVVGQLQHRGEISFAHSRDALVKVRDRITSATITDGWGNFVAVSR